MLLMYSEMRRMFRCSCSEYGEENTDLTYHPWQKVPGGLLKTLQVLLASFLS